MVTALCCFVSGWLASLVSFYKYLIYVSEASLDVPPSHVSQNGFLHFYLMECLVNKGENEWHKFMFAGGAIFSGIAFGIMLDFRGSLSCGQIFANGIADFEGEREGVSFWSCSSCSFFVLIVSSLAHVFGDQDCFFFFLLLF